MSFLGDWNTYQGELESAFKDMLQNGDQPHKDALALLKTADLKEALKIADTAVAKNDIDGIRKAQAKTQKFMLMYANQYKAAKATTQSGDMLSDTLNMFNAYMVRTQVGVAKKCDEMIQAAKLAETNQAKKQVLEIKSALSPLKFQYDWKAAKKDFENETGVKKPSAKIMGEYRKSSGLDSAMEEMDKACQKAEPANYRKAYAKFDIAATNYASVLEKALASDKAADPIYKQKCEGLKSVLSTINRRAVEKLKMLDKLGV